MVQYSGYLLGKVQLDGAIRSETLANVVQSLVYRYYSPDSGSKLVYDHNRYSVECSENGLKLSSISPVTKSKDEGFESDCESILSTKLADGGESDLSQLIESLEVSGKYTESEGSSSDDSAPHQTSSSAEGQFVAELFESCPPKLVFNVDDNNSSSGNGSDSEEFSLTSIEKLHHSWEELPYVEKFYSYPIEDVVFCHCDVNYPSALVWVVRNSSSMIGLVVKFRHMSDASNLFQAYRDLHITLKPSKYGGRSVGRCGPSKELLQSSSMMNMHQSMFEPSDSAKLLEQDFTDADCNPYGEQVICIKPKPAYAEAPKSLNYLFEPENFEFESSSSLSSGGNGGKGRQSFSSETPKFSSNPQCNFDLDEDEKSLMQRLKRHNLGGSTNPVVTMPRNFLNKIFNPASRQANANRLFNTSNAIPSTEHDFSLSASISSFSDPENDSGSSAGDSGSKITFVDPTTELFESPGLLSSSSSSAQQEESERFAKMLKPNHLVGSISRSKLRIMKGNPTMPLLPPPQHSPTTSTSTESSSDGAAIVETTSILKGSKTTEGLSSSVRKPAIAAKKPVMLVPIKAESVRAPTSRYPKEAYFTHAVSRNSSTFAPYQRSLNFYHPASAPHGSRGKGEFGAVVARVNPDGRPVLVPFSSWMELAEVAPKGMHDDSHPHVSGHKMRPGKKPYSKRSIGNLKGINKGTSKILLRDVSGYPHGVWANLSQKFKRNLRENLVPKINWMWTSPGEEPKRKPNKEVTFNAWATVQMI